MSSGPGRDGGSELAEAGGPLATVVPGWVLRFALAGCVVALVAISMSGQTHIALASVGGFLLVVVGAVAVASPGGTAVGLLLLAVLGIQVVSGVEVIGVRVISLAALLVAIHLLASVCASVPLDGRIQLRALRPVAVRGGAALAALAAVVLALKS